MHLVEGATPKPPDDEARLAQFGHPVFGFVPQPRLKERGWSWYGVGGAMLEAEAHYWLADRTGNFWFEDSPAGPVGIAELRGFVFTDVPGSTSRGGDPVRDALNQHLQYVVMNHAPNPHEFGSRRWATHHAEQEQEIEVSTAEHSTLVVDERPHEAVTVRAAEFMATSAAIEGRIVTVVIHQADIDKIDLRLTYRRPPEPAETN